MKDSKKQLWVGIVGSVITMLWLINTFTGCVTKLLSCGLEFQKTIASGLFTGFVVMFITALCTYITNKNRVFNTYCVKAITAYNMYNILMTRLNMDRNVSSRLALLDNLYFHLAECTTYAGIEFAEFRLEKLMAKNRCIWEVNQEFEKMIVAVKRFSDQFVAYFDSHPDGVVDPQCEFARQSKYFIQSMQQFHDKLQSHLDQFEKILKEKM